MPNRARWAFDCYEYGMKISVVFFVFVCLLWNTLVDGWLDRSPPPPPPLIQTIGSRLNDAAAAAAAVACYTFTYRNSQSVGDLAFDLSCNLKPVSEFVDGCAAEHYHQVRDNVIFCSQ